MTELEFKTVFDTYRMNIFYYCNQFLNDRMQSEDITSIVFVALWENQDHLCFKSHDALKGYLLVLAKRKCLDYLKTEGNRKKRNASYEEPIEEIEYDHITCNVITHIHHVIEQLSPQAKRIFKLHFFEEKKIGEISKLLNIASQTTSNSIYHSLHIIRGKIKNREIISHG